MIRHSLGVHDLYCTHSLVSLQWSEFSQWQMLPLTENCLQYQKLCSYKGERSGCYVHLCYQDEKQCRSRPFYSQPAKTAAMVHGMSWPSPPTSPYPTLMLVQNLSSQRIAPTDNMQPKSAETKWCHRWKPVKTDISLFSPLILLTISSVSTDSLSSFATGRSPAGGSLLLLSTYIGLERRAHTCRLGLWRGQAAKYIYYRGAGAGPAGTAAVGPMLEAKLMNLIKGWLQKVWLSNNFSVKFTRSRAPSCLARPVMICFRRHRIILNCNQSMY